MSCPTCGKRRYSDRKTAKAALRRLSWRHGMNAYRCGQFWHIGHASAAAKAWYRRRDEEHAA